LNRPTDAIVVGAGIVGAACAWRLAREGMLVTVVDPRGIAAGTTASGMGHIVVMDGSEAELALTSRSRALWEELSHELPGAAGWNRRGTLWVARDLAELEAAKKRAQSMLAVGVEVVDAARLKELEPRLRLGLSGGLLVAGDAIVRPPEVARWMLEQSKARLIDTSPVRKTRPGRVRLESGVELAAGIVVLAAGLWLRALTGLPLTAKKGHLASIEGPVGFCKHQIVEMGYVAKTHTDGESVSFNIQPRVGGELVVGSSRQPGVESADVEQSVVEKMLRRAIEFMPDLESFRVSREWTGLRAATPDGLPVIGELPGRERVYVAGGHEGLGLTMAMGTAEMIADAVAGRKPQIDPAPYSPKRFAPMLKR